MQSETKQAKRPQRPPKVKEEKTRQRKAHKKSFGGCTACKKRHLRCDGSKPLCRDCLIRGTECIYTTPPSSATSTSQDAGGQDLKQAWIMDAVIKSPLMNALSQTTFDPFESLPITMNKESSELYAHFIDHRQRMFVPLADDEEGADMAFDFRTAVQHSTGPAWMRTVICLAFANRVLMRGGQEQAFDKTFRLMQFRLLQAVRTEMCNAADSGWVLLWCISMISALVFSDAGIGQDSTALVHLRGVFALLSMNGEKGGLHPFTPIMKRCNVIALAFIYAGRHKLPTPGNGLCQERAPRQWSQASFFFIIIAHEFLSGPLRDNDFLATQKRERPLLRWVWHRLEQRWQQEAESLDAGASSDMSGDEWVRETAGAAYAMVTGWTRPDSMRLAGNVHPEQVRMDAWFDEMIAKWEASGQIMTAEVSSAVIARMLEVRRVEERELMKWACGFG